MSLQAPGGSQAVEAPRACVVIPTHARRESLLRVLRALSRQEQVAPDAFEVIVICDGDVDGSAPASRVLAAELPYGLRVLEQTNQGPAVARNQGVAEARAQLIVFLDDDVVPDPALVATHLAAHAGRGNLVAIGPLLPPPEFRLNAWGAWEERTLCRQYDDIISGKWQVTNRQFYTGNASLLRRHIVEAGGFDAAYRRAEDVELAQRLSGQGLEFTLLPEARGWHYVWRSFDAWQRMAAAYGEADVTMARAGRQLELRLALEHYRERAWLVQFITAVCLGRPAVRAGAVVGLGMLARCADRLQWLRLAMVACSLIYNVRLYDGIARSLGGRAVFRELQRQVDENVRPMRMPQQRHDSQAASVLAR
jgi:GT2 family glycosyltransferase